jgi:hypothetical protein
MYSLFKRWRSDVEQTAEHQVVAQQVKERLVDDAMDAYIDWREECISVGEAYGRWASAQADDAQVAFAGYVAALDGLAIADFDPERAAVYLGSDLGPFSPGMLLAAELDITMPSIADRDTAAELNPGDTNGQAITASDPGARCRDERPRRHLPPA